MADIEILSTGSFISEPSVPEALGAPSDLAVKHRGLVSAKLASNVRVAAEAGGARVFWCASLSNSALYEFTPLSQSHHLKSPSRLT